MLTRDHSLESRPAAVTSSRPPSAMTLTEDDAVWRDLVKAQMSKAAAETIIQVWPRPASRTPCSATDSRGQEDVPPPPQYAADEKSGYLGYHPNSGAVSIPSPLRVSRPER